MRGDIPAIGELIAPKAKLSMKMILENCILVVVRLREMSMFVEIF